LKEEAGLYQRGLFRSGHNRTLP